MGFQHAELRATALLSAHNSDRDERDEALWKDLYGRVAEIVGDPKYEPIIAMMG
jgi:hypothetical protein